MGIEPTQARRMMEESLECVLALLAGEQVTRETDWFCSGTPTYSLGVSPSHISRWQSRRFGPRTGLGWPGGWAHRS